MREGVDPITLTLMMLLDEMVNTTLPQQRIGDGTETRE